MNILQQIVRECLLDEAIEVIHGAGAIRDAKLKNPNLTKIGTIPFNKAKNPDACGEIYRLCLDVANQLRRCNVEMQVHITNNKVILYANLSMSDIPATEEATLQIVSALTMSTDAKVADDATQMLNNAQKMMRQNYNAAPFDFIEGISVEAFIFPMRVDKDNLGAGEEAYALANRGANKQIVDEFKNLSIQGTHCDICHQNRTRNTIVIAKIHTRNGDLPSPSGHRDYWCLGTECFQKIATAFSVNKLQRIYLIFKQFERDIQKFLKGEDYGRMESERMLKSFRQDDVDFVEKQIFMMAMYGGMRDSNRNVLSAVIKPKMISANADRKNNMSQERLESKYFNANSEQLYHSMLKSFFRYGQHFYSTYPCPNGTSDNLLCTLGLKMCAGQKFDFTTQNNSAINVYIKKELQMTPSEFMSNKDGMLNKLKADAIRLFFVNSPNANHRLHVLEGIEPLAPFEGRKTFDGMIVDCDLSQSQNGVIAMEMMTNQGFLLRFTAPTKNTLSQKYQTGYPMRVTGEYGGGDGEASYLKNAQILVGDIRRMDNPKNAVYKLGQKFQDVQVSLYSFNYDTGVEFIDNDGNLLAIRFSDAVGDTSDVRDEIQYVLNKMKAGRGSKRKTNPVFLLSGFIINRGFYQAGNGRVFEVASPSLKEVGTDELPSGYYD